MTAVEFSHQELLKYSDLVTAGTMFAVPGVILVAAGFATALTFPTPPQPESGAVIMSQEMARSLVGGMAYMGPGAFLSAIGYTFLSMAGDFRSANSSRGEDG